jgi:hypothetical protein
MSLSERGKVTARSHSLPGCHRQPFGLFNDPEPLDYFLLLYLLLITVSTANAGRLRSFLAWSTCFVTHCTTALLKVTEPSIT